MGLGLVQEHVHSRTPCAGAGSRVPGTGPCRGHVPRHAAGRAADDGNFRICFPSCVPVAIEMVTLGRASDSGGGGGGGGYVGV